MTYEIHIYRKNTLYGHRHLHPYGLRKFRKCPVRTEYPVVIDGRLRAQSDGQAYVGRHQR